MDHAASAPYVLLALAYHVEPLLQPLQRQSSRAQCYALASADSPSLIYKTITVAYLSTTYITWMMQYACLAQ
ncbi:hypothetical protein V8C42DRAFT_321801 [Trichoderma barbatum]